MRITKETAITAVAVGVAFAVGQIAPALAASDPDWASNAAGGIDQLTAIAITIVSALIGLAIVGFGASVCMSGGHIDWRKLGGFLFAGILVGVGPSAVAWWINYTQNGGN